MSEQDKPWQRVPKHRRAKVYRAFGQRIREAKEDREPELADDMRAAFGVLRAHAKAKATKKPKRSR